MAGKEADVQKALGEVEAVKAQQLEALEGVARLNVAEARQMVIKRGEEEAQHDLSRRFYELEKEFKLRADENARRIITLAINRLATDVVYEATTLRSIPAQR